MKPCWAYALMFLNQTITYQLQIRDNAEEAWHATLTAFDALDHAQKLANILQESNKETRIVKCTLIQELVE